MNEKILADVEQSILNYYNTHPVLLDAWGVAIDSRHVAHYLEIGRARFKILIDYIEATIPRGARILEVGAGYSVVLLYLKEIGYHVQATELPLCVDAFSSVLLEQNITVTPWDLHLDAEPLAGQHFDVVLASEILEHLQMSLGSAMGRLARRLASDGCLIVTTPNLYRMNNLLKIVRGRNISEPFAERAVLRNGVVVDNRTHPREPVRAELALAMTQNRMRIIHADAFNSHPRHRLVRWLYAIGPKRFRDHIMLVGRPTTLD